MNRSVHGYDYSAATIAKLKIGLTSKSDVEAELGSPSTISAFNDDIWYYINLHVRQVAIFAPSVTSEKVLQLKFKNDVLYKINTYKRDATRGLEFNKDQSKVEGDDEGLAKDFFLNIGRFNKSKKNRNSSANDD